MLHKIKKTVFVGMSGGVDSSVAAYLLKKQGYNVVGVFMRCYNIDGCAERDAEDARRVAEHIGIPFYVWDFEKEYKRDVVKYMIDGYRKGITPNPDVMCNRQIKFGLFLKKALVAGADYVATGHYVRAERAVGSVRNVGSVGGENAGKRLERAKRSNKRSDQAFQLFTANDANKDQSYFLWTLTQEQLKHCLFPIGEYVKPKVRAIARRAGLPTADKKDSQGVCFLGKFSVGDFLKQHIKPKRGAVVTTTGEKIGEHDGAYFYTIGQRHGVVKNHKSQITNHKQTRSDSEPLYVSDKNIKTNTIVMAEGDENAALYKKEVTLQDMNFISHLAPRTSSLSVMARVRYRQALAKAVLVVEDVRSDVNVKTKLRLQRAKRQTKRSDKTYKLIFDKPVKFVAEGQSAVFYSTKGEMLGGGVIQVTA